MSNNKLEIINLNVSILGKKILKGLNLTVKKGEIHFLMGENGSGKSTFVNSLLGHPDYIVAKDSRILLNGQNIISLKTYERVKAGLFMTFQSPVSIAGISVTELLRASLLNFKKNNILEIQENIEKNADELKIAGSLLTRSINEGYSGGEKKKIEILQLITLKPKFAIIDEMDTGLDIDALKRVTTVLKKYIKSERPGVILITHHPKLLNFIKPDFVHIIRNGRIVKSGDRSLAERLEDRGYAEYK